MIKCSKKAVTVISHNFLLYNKTAQLLYHESAGNMPIIDYHNHLPADQIANDVNFQNLTQAWLYGDHYKWRAMRANGIDESYCTGNKSDYEKFQEWAATVPYTLRNPLYHWTHLELQRYFNITDILNPVSVKKIYDHCSHFLQTKEFSTRNLLRKMNVEIVCTTDDPSDSLEHHKKIQGDNFEIKVLPTFRPDKALQTANAELFNEYVNELEAVSNKSITSFNDYLDTLKLRHDDFSNAGCVIADNGCEYLPFKDFTEAEIKNIFQKLRSGNNISAHNQEQFKTALLLQLAEWNYEKSWVQQFHLGALRNNNTQKMQQLGADTGFDSIGDFPQAYSLSKFLNKLNSKNKLAKTILYNLNPADNAVFATMCGNFNDDGIPGKMQHGAAWWFSDQKDGITNHLNTLSNMGLLSRFVGMLTDSRSFLSFPRHEYFRRILCNIFGDEIEKGELPDDIEWTGKIIKDICYYNTKKYFNWHE